MIETMIISVGVNSLWQAGLLALGAAAAIRIFKITAPKFRVYLWSAAFFASAMAPLAAFMPGTAIEAPVMTASGAATAPLANPASQFAVGGAETSPMVITYGDLLAPLAALIWIGGAFYCLFVLISGGVRVARLRRDAEPVAASRLPRSIKLRAHASLTSPLATGVLRPVILVPCTMARDLAAPGTQHALAHEVAHVKRGDLIANFAEQMVMCVFWWNPVMRAMGACIAENREMACDDQAVAVSRDAGSYARAIIECAERAVSGEQKLPGAHALSAAGRPSSMSKRITRLVSDSYLTTAKVRLESVVLAAVMVLSAIAFVAAATPRAALAANTENAQSVEALTDAQQLGRSLVAAIVDGDRARAESLVAAGADINAVLEKDGTPLIAAVNRESISLAAWLIALGADVDQYALYDETALISAVRTGNADMVRLLIEAGADVNLEAPTQKGEFRSPMGEARRMKRDDLAAMLVAAGARE